MAIKINPTQFFVEATKVELVAKIVRHSLAPGVDAFHSEVSFSVVHTE